MEYFDVVDENNQPTGQTISRAEAHEKGIFHQTVHVWIINSKHELLIQKRSPQVKANPNLWHISAAGHISAGDDSMTTAIKETSEELGITIDPKNIEFLFNFKNQEVLNNGTLLNNHFVDVYLVPLDLDVTKVHLQPEEVSEIKFVPFRELEKIINGRDKNFVMIDEAYQKLFNILHTRYGQ